MRIKHFTLRYSPSLGGFDDTPLQEFLRDKDLLAYHEHLFRVHDVPHLLCVVRWQDDIVLRDEMGAERESRRGDRKDPAQGLSEGDRRIFQRLRGWRMERAHAEGHAPFIVLTNDQLLAIIEKKPENLTALATIDGIGPAKVKRYGRDILAQLHGGARAAGNGAAAGGTGDTPAAEPQVQAGAPLAPAAPSPVEAESPI